MAIVATVISKDFGREFGSLGDYWERAGRTPVVLEHPIQSKHHQYNTNTYNTNEN